MRDPATNHTYTATQGEWKGRTLNGGLAVIVEAIEKMVLGGRDWEKGRRGGQGGEGAKACYILRGKAHVSGHHVSLSPSLSPSPTNYFFSYLVIRATSTQSTFRYTARTMSTV